MTLRWSSADTIVYDSGDTLPSNVKKGTIAINNANGEIRIFNGASWSGFTDAMFIRYEDFNPTPNDVEAGIYYSGTTATSNTTKLQQALDAARDEKKYVLIKGSYSLAGNGVVVPEEVQLFGTGNKIGTNTPGSELVWMGNDPLAFMVLLGEPKQNVDSGRWGVTGIHDIMLRCRQADASSRKHKALLALTRFEKIFITNVNISNSFNHDPVHADYAKYYDPNDYLYNSGWSFWLIGRYGHDLCYVNGLHIFSSGSGGTDNSAGTQSYGKGIFGPSNDVATASQGGYTGVRFINPRTGATFTTDNSNRNVPSGGLDRFDFHNLSFSHQRIAIDMSSGNSGKISRIYSDNILSSSTDSNPYIAFKAPLHRVEIEQIVYEVDNFEFFLKNGYGREGNVRTNVKPLLYIDGVNCFVHAIYLHQTCSKRPYGVAQYNYRDIETINNFADPDPSNPSYGLVRFSNIQVGEFPNYAIMRNFGGAGPKQAWAILDVDNSPTANVLTRSLVTQDLILTTAAKLASGSTSHTAVANRLYLSRFEVQRTCMLNEIAVNISTAFATNENIALAVYKANSSTPNTPDNARKVYESTILADSPGRKTATPNLRLTPAVYYVGLWTPSATGSFTKYANAVLAPNKYICAYIDTQLPLPDSLGLTTASNIAPVTAITVTLI